MSGMASSRVNVDIVTGKRLVTVYFDPYKAVDAAVPNEDWLGANLYIPAGILSTDKEKGILTVKLPNGEVFKVPESSCTIVNPQDETGVDDILQLKEFSEMSLIHSLRIRYSKDEIYFLIDIFRHEADYLYNVLHASFVLIFHSCPCSIDFYDGTRDILN